MRFIWKTYYIVFDLLQEYPVQVYSNIVKSNDGTEKRTNPRGIIGQYFRENNITEKPVRARYINNNSWYADIVGQSDNTMGRFVVFEPCYDLSKTVDHYWDLPDEEYFSILRRFYSDDTTVDRLKEDIRNYDNFFMYYNRSGYEFLTKSYIEKKISKKQEERRDTYCVEDKMGEFKLFETTATSVRQAINKFFKAYNISEKPKNFYTLMKELGEFGYEHREQIYGRFSVYRKSCPQMNRLYNRDGYATLGDWTHNWGNNDIRCVEYTISELLEKLEKIDQF